MADRISTKPEGNGRDAYKLELVGLANDERPKMAVQLSDANDKALVVQPVEADGSFAIPPEVLKRASRVTIGAADDKGASGAMPRSATARASSRRN